MDYKATIHTLEIAVDTKDLEPSFLGCAKEKVYVNAVRYLKRNRCSLAINPHKFTCRNSDNEFHFEYCTLEKYRETMERLEKDLGITKDIYSVRRLDVCIDTRSNYEESEKLLRLIVLMLAVEIGADNRYLSVDPFTQAIKTIRISRNISNNGELQIEHYDRSQIDQIKWDYYVMNRLELRAKGIEAGKKRTEEMIIDRWEKRLQGILEPSILLCAENETNNGLYSMWLRDFKFVDTLTKRQTKNIFNRFILSNLNHVFTEEQLLDLFCRFGEDIKTAKKSVSNLKSRNKSVLDGQLFSFSEIQSEVNSICAALDLFICGNSQS